jgi:hypothetical protein
MPNVQYKNVPFPLYGGIETKVADLMVQPPKLLVAENCFSARPGSLRRRRALATLSNTTVDGTTLGSYAAGGTAAAVALYKGNLVAFDDAINPSAITRAPNLYEYSESAGAWSEHFGYAPGHVEAEGISTHGNGSGGIRSADMAVANSYTLYASVEGDTTADIRVSLQDANGTFLGSRVLIFSEATATPTYANLRVIARLNVIYVFFAKQSTRDLMVWIIDCTSRATIASALGTLTVTPIAAVTVAADLHAAGLAVYDVDSNSAFGIFLVYKTTTANQIKLGFVNASGVLASTTTKATTADATSVTCAAGFVLTTSIHGIVYTVSAAADVFAFLMSWNGAAWTTVQTSIALAAFAGGFVENVACRFDSATVLRIWYTGDASTGPAVTGAMGAGAAQDTARHRIFQKTYTTAGVAASGGLTVLRAWMASRPFQGVDGQLYFWAIVGKRLTKSKQPTHFLINAVSCTPVARVHVGVAAIYEGGIGSHLPSVVQLTADPDGSNYGAFASALMYITHAVNGTADNDNGRNVGLRAVRWFLHHYQSHQLAEVGESLYMAGGILQYYDGYSMVESGFLAYTESDLINMAPSPTGSMTPSAIYYYRLVPEFTNARGEREQGTDTGPSVSVTLGAGDGQVTVTFPSLIMTRKMLTLVGAGGTADLVWGVYRTGANPASNAAAYNRVGQVINNTTADQMSFTDGMSDANAALNEELYLVSGQVDHLAPNSNHLMCIGKGRMFLAGDPESPHTVFVSLLRSPGEPLSFNDALQIVLPDLGGKITGMAVMNEALVVFKQTAIYRVRGDGPDNTLTSGSFLDPELIATGIGCDGQRSVVVTPMGVMFKSARGFQLLTPGYEVEYIGAPLEGLTGSDNPSSSGSVIDGAVLLPMAQHVRFCGSSTWIYDYWQKQWYLFSNQGLLRGPGVEWNGVVTGAGSAGIQYEDDGASYTLGQMRIVLALLKGQSSQEDLHVRRVALTGLIENDVDGFTVKLYANRKTTIAQTNAFAARPVGPMAEQFRTVDAARIVSMLKVEVIDNNETPTGILTLNEIIFEVGARSSGLSARIAP